MSSIKYQCILRTLAFYLLAVGLGGGVNNAAVQCCDLEEYFSEKQVSVEASARDARVVFRGLSVNAGVSANAAATAGGMSASGGAGSAAVAAAAAAAAVAAALSEQRGVYTAYFELIDTYKGSDAVQMWGTNRQLNVTIFSRPVPDCNGAQDDIPREYIVFCQLFDGHLRATSIAKWDDYTDQRVWSALGWAKWSEWSGCSVSCSSGIQQRTRRCVRPPCPGFNVEQRHCNLFSCAHAVNPLAVEETRYYHPSKDHWRHVPDRPNAWRLQPNNYIWLPSSQIFNNNASFPKAFSLFITLRILNESLGTVFSLRSRRRQDTYLSLEVAGGDLKLIHATSNGTDVVRIPASLNDHNWHQIAISIRDNSVVDNYVDCQWSRTNILKVGSLDIPDDSDLIIGYLFAGDLEQLTIDPDPALVGLQCYSTITPIIDPSLAVEIFQGNNGHNIVRNTQRDPTFPASSPTSKLTSSSGSSSLTSSFSASSASDVSNMSPAPVPTTIGQNKGVHRSDAIASNDNDASNIASDNGKRKKLKRFGPARKWLKLD